MKKVFFLITYIFFLSFLSIYLSAQALNVESVVQSGHYAGITDVEYSNDGKFIVTSSDDKTIKLWRAEDGKEIRTYLGSSSSMNIARIHSDNSLILGVNSSGEILVWETVSGTLLKNFAIENDEFTCASFHPKEKILITGTRKSHVITYDIETGNQIRVYKAEPADIGYSKNYEFLLSQTVVFSNDGKYILAGKENYTAVVWETESGKEFMKYRRNRNTCSGCATDAIFSNDQKYVITAYSDTVKVFDLKTGTYIKGFSERKGNIGKLVISADNNYLGTEQYGNIYIWNFKTGDLIQTLTSDSKRATSISFNPSENKIITGNEKRTADIWNIKTGKILYSLRGYLNDIDEKILNHSYMYWAALINETRMSPDGKYIAVGRAGNNARLLEFETGRQVKLLKGHSRMVICLNFSKDGKYLATGGLDGKAILWDMETLEPKQVFQYRDSSLVIFSIDISPDNKYVATADWAGYVVLWDIETGKYVSSLYPHDGMASYRIKFSPNGLYIFSAGLDKKLKLMELDSREEIMTYKGHTSIISSIENHPTEQKVITSSWDQTIRVWDFFSGLQVMKIKAHEGGTYAAKFNNNGNYIISGGNDNQAKVWDAEKGNLKASFSGHKGAVGDVNITPDDQFLISGGRDGTIRIWNIEKQNELVSLTFLHNNDWFIKNPGGYFDASEGAYKDISFVKGTDIYSIDQFFDGFYTPGLYRKAIFEEDAELKQNVYREIENSPPPAVEIIAPEEGSEDEPLAMFLVKITNQGGGISELKVLQNGKRLNIDDQDLLKLKKEGQYVMKSFDVILVPGKNNIEISALSNAKIESKEASVNIYHQGTPKNSSCYVLSIGINKYENPALNLNYARPDAEAFTQLVKGKGEKLFKEIKTFELTDKKATRENILNTLDQISQQINIEDVFIFFYAGHGSMVDDYFYFMTTESTGLYQKEKLKLALHVQKLQEKLKEIKALKQVVFIDACHSGTSIDLLAMRGSGEEKALAQLSRSSGIHVMASSESQQQAAEIKSLGHGVFTYVLLNALQGKADGTPKDDKVTVYELKSYIDDQVPEVSYELIQHKQFPSTFSIGHDFPLVLE